MNKNKYLLRSRYSFPFQIFIIIIAITFRKNFILERRETIKKNIICCVVLYYYNIISAICACYTDKLTPSSVGSENDNDNDDGTRGQNTGKFIANLPISVSL